eukprot:5072850-Pleurochrysis_carterae.AAC.1
MHGGGAGGTAPFAVRRSLGAPAAEAVRRSRVRGRSSGSRAALDSDTSSRVICHLASNDSPAPRTVCHFNAVLSISPRDPPFFFAGATTCVSFLRAYRDSTVHSIAWVTYESLLLLQEATSESFLPVISAFLRRGVDMQLSCDVGRLRVPCKRNRGLAVPERRFQYVLSAFSAAAPLRHTSSGLRHCCVFDAFHLGHEVP